MMFKDKYIHKFYAFALAAVFALTLAGCGGGGGGSAAAPDPDPPAMPTAYEVAVDAIAAAETEADARAAVTAAVAAGITGAQLQSLNMKVAERVTALAEMAAEEQRKMLVDAAKCEAATQACVDAHNALIEALEGDVAKLADDEDATNAEEQAAQKALEDAKAKRDEVAMALADDMRDTETGMKVTAAETAAEGLEDARTAEDIADAEEAIAAAKRAIAEGDDPDAFMAVIEAAEMAVARAKELNAIDAAIMAADTAADGLVDDSDADAVAAAQALIDAAKALVAGNEHLTDAEETSYTGEIADLQRPVTLAKNRNDDAAKKEEDARKAAEDEKQRKANEAMAATAAKLYAGIGAPMGVVGTYATTDRIAGYAGTNDSQIAVQIGTDPAATAATATLSEDKKTTVPDNHGWEGKRYTHSVTTGADKGDMYEAVVYSDVGAPTMGAKFSAQYPGTEAFVSDAGVVTVDTTDPDTPASRVAIDSFTLSAGTKTFPLPDPNPTDVAAISEAGSFHGVRGTYKCVPTSATDTCSATLATKGLTLTGGTWTFTPTDANARVTESADSDYSSYGWWLLRTKADGSLTAGAFVDDRNTAPTTDVSDLVAGSATYRGGAAGKYALSSATGGTNDAGHFTARATLEADFEKDEVTGTIDRFMADGESKDWTVELKKSALFNNGTVIGDPTRDGIDLTAAPVADDVAQKTVWTIGGKAEAADGEWSGALKDTADTKTDTTGVPKVGTGTFYTEYGTAGRMVGAFGVKKQ